jgi:hypothetical protein
MGSLVEQIAASERERAHLRTVGGHDPHGGADAKAIGGGAAQIEHDRMAGIGIVAADGELAVIAGENEVEVTVAVEIAERRAKADAEVIEAPRRADVLKPQVAEVAEGQVPLGQRRTRLHDPDALGQALGGQACVARGRRS